MRAKLLETSVTCLTSNRSRRAVLDLGPGYLQLCRESYLFYFLIDDDDFTLCVFNCLVFSLFVWGVFVPLENCSLIWKRHHYRWRAANFDIWSALMVIQLKGFFNMPHILWHSPRTHDTLVAKRWAVELSLPAFYDLGLSQPEIELRSPACEANALPLRHLGYISNGKDQKYLMQKLLYCYTLRKKNNIEKPKNNHLFQMNIADNKKNFLVSEHKTMKTKITLEL